VKTDEGLQPVDELRVGGGPVSVLGRSGRAGDSGRKFRALRPARSPKIPDRYCGGRTEERWLNQPERLSAPWC
jgi:hypothetical protein